MVKKKKKKKHNEAGFNLLPNKYAGEVSTGFLINSSALNLKKRFSQALAASGYQISTEQYSVLNQLWLKDNIYQSNLAGRVFKDRHNVSRIVKGLEARNLIKKIPDEHDARLNRCVLTEEGRALREPLLEISSQVLDEAFRGISEKKITDLRDVLMQLLANLEEDLL